jgi:hypothetical protein
MQILWRRVTWYSRFLAYALFIALPFAGFWAGFRYAQVVGPLTIMVSDRSPGENASDAAPAANTSSTASSTLQDILAKHIVTIPSDKTFSFSKYPNVTFRVNAVSRADGGVPVALCGSGDFMFIRYTDIFSPPGACLDATKTLTDGSPLALAVVDLEIDNRSNAFVDGRFVQILTTRTVNGAPETDRATENPAWTSYGARPFSTKRILLGFEIPRDLEEVQLIFGDYGAAEGGNPSAEEFFGKTVGGYIVNFTAKTVTDIPG